MKKSLIYLLLVIIPYPSMAQFLGGIGSGYNTSIYLSENSYASGNIKSGYKLSRHSSSYDVYKGGDKSGYRNNLYQSNKYVSLGGNMSGYKINLKSNNIFITKGGNKAGYNNRVNNNSNTLSKGGNHTGYYNTENIHTYVWDGDIGTGWNVGENWDLNDIPRSRHNVIIPTGLINYPKVNMGLMSVGQVKNESLYYCKNLMIEHEAELTLRVNNSLENYGKIIVLGQLIVLSEASPAIYNGTRGLIQIIDGGVVTWQ